MEWFKKEERNEKKGLIKLSNVNIFIFLTMSEKEPI